MDYSIIPDTSVIITTVVCIVVAILLLVVSFRIPMKWLSGLMRITTTATVSLLICFVVQIPTTLTIDESEIVIKQIVGEKRFLCSEVELAKIDAAVLKDSVRIFGSGGAGGYIGWFKSPSIGKFYMIASGTKDLLLIQTDTKKYVINCLLENV